MIVDKILQSKNKLYLAIAGGGLSVLGTLTENGGAGHVFMGARTPYDFNDLVDIVGNQHKAVSQKTAQLLSSYITKTPLSDSLPKLEDNTYFCLGIGVTCSLVKRNERKGREHRIILSTCEIYYESNKYLDMIDITLVESRTRKQEEDLVANLILAMADCRLNLTKSYPLQNKSTMKFIGLTDKDKVTWNLT